MSRFRTAGQTPASWAGVCPGHHESAGKRKSGKTRHGNRWLGDALGTAAMAAARTKEGVGEQWNREYRRGVQFAEQFGCSITALVERVICLEGVLVGLSSAFPFDLVFRPGQLTLLGRSPGRTGAVAELGVGQVRLGQPSASFGARIVVHCGDAQVLDASGASQLLYIEGDAPQDGADPGQGHDDVAAVRMVTFGAQVGCRRERLVFQMVQLFGALAQPAHLVIESIRHQRSAGQLLIVAAIGVFRCRPAARAQRAQRLLQRR